MWDCQCYGFCAQGHFWWTARGGLHVALQSHVHGRLGGLGGGEHARTDVGQTFECTPDRERGLPRESPHSQHVGWQDGGNCALTGQASQGDEAVHVCGGRGGRSDSGDASWTAPCGSRSCAGTLSSRGPGNPNEGQDVRGEVHNPQQAHSPSWKVDVPEQNTAASSAYEVHGASETHSPAQAARAWNSQNARRRDSAVAQGATTGSPVGGRQAAAGSSNRDITASALHGGLFWELVHALKLVAVVMKDKLASLPRPRVSPHIWEEFWNKWPGQWATLLRIFLARTVVEVTELGKKAQGTVHATDGCERDQEWLCMQCGKCFPSRAACIGHQGVHGRDPTRSLAAGLQCPVCRSKQRVNGASAPRGGC